MKDCNIAFIGGGNMAQSLIGGLIAQQTDPQDIYVSDPNPDKLLSLASRYPDIHTFNDNNEAIKECAAVILAVKPQKMRNVVKKLSAHYLDQSLLISIAAGIRVTDISSWLDRNDVSIIRAMPNTPSLVQTGASALYANSAASNYHRQLAESVLSSVGITLWIDDETDMDIVTALSGSGPAYFFLVMEVMEQAAKEMGLAPEKARLLCSQTALGAAKMVLASQGTPATLRECVTSPGGTTECALQELEKGGIRDLFKHAIMAAASRSRELAACPGKNTPSVN